MVPDLNFEIRQGHITTVGMNSLNLTHSTLYPALFYVRYFKYLQKLYCDSNQLTQLPELPEGLQELSCDNNPLTPETVTYLQEFKRRHPDANIDY